MDKDKVELIGDEIIRLEKLFLNPNLTKKEKASIENKIENIVMQASINDMIEIDNYIMAKKN